MDINQYLFYIVIIAFVVLFLCKTSLTIYNKKFCPKKFVVGLITVLLSIPIVYLLKPILIYVCIFAGIVTLLQMNL